MAHNNSMHHEENERGTQEQQHNTNTHGHPSPEFGIVEREVLYQPYSDSQRLALVKLYADDADSSLENLGEETELLKEWEIIYLQKLTTDMRNLKRDLHKMDTGKMRAWGLLFCEELSLPQFLYHHQPQCPPQCLLYPLYLRIEHMREACYPDTPPQTRTLDQARASREHFLRKALAICNELRRIIFGLFAQKYKPSADNSNLPDHMRWAVRTRRAMKRASYRVHRWRRRRNHVGLTATVAIQPDTS